MDILLCLAELTPSVDEAGFPYRPLPKAKRIMSSPQCLPHITQMFLTNEPSIVNKAAMLVHSLGQYNENVFAKLYTYAELFVCLFAC